MCHLSMEWSLIFDRSKKQNFKSAIKKIFQVSEICCTVSFYRNKFISHWYVMDKTYLTPVYFLYIEMADADPQFKRLLLPAEETLFEQLLRFGLYVGAVFQIMCLLSIVMYQNGPSDGVAALKVPCGCCRLPLRTFSYSNDSCHYLPYRMIRVM